MSIEITSHHIEEGAVPNELANHPAIKTRGGTVMISQYGVKKATQSFVAFYQDPYEFAPKAYQSYLFVRNGGPSSPASAYNAQIFSGVHFIRHSEDGHLRSPILRRNPSSLMRHHHVVNIDGVGTGASELLDPLDPAWHQNLEIDAKVTTTFIKWYIEKYGNEYTIPMLMGSSYAAFPMTLAALELTEQEIPPAALIYLGAAFIKSATSGVAPTALPTLATTAQFHKRVGAREQELPPRALFDEVYTFMDKQYRYIFDERNYISHRDRDEILTRLLAYTGLSKEILLEHDLRVSPSLIRTHLLEGRLLSAIDSRLAFEPGDYRIDPALDQWEPHYINAITDDPQSRGYPSIMSQHYKGITLFPDWKYPEEIVGRFTSERRHLGRYVLRLQQDNPNLRIVDFNGFYDLTRPAPGSREFWKLYRKNTPLRNDPRMTISSDVQNGVNSFILPIGHQLVNDWESRRFIAKVINNLAALVTVRKIR